MDLMSICALRVPGRIEDINLQLRHGEVMGLIGPNGSGKSSLLNALAGLLDWQGGIQIDGVDIRSLNSQQRARQIALQPQFVDSAWSLSVHDIVSMGRLPWGDSDQQIIQSVMNDANIEQFADRRVDALSGGERSRVWLARVLANQPKILLVDEPVANLDIHYQQQVMKILKKYAQAGHAVFIAIHDLSLAARYCDRLCLLKQGQQVIADETVKVLDPEILSGVFNQSIYVNIDQDPPVVMAN